MQLLAEFVNSPIFERAEYQKLVMKHEIDRFKSKVSQDFTDFAQKNVMLEEKDHQHLKASIEES